MNMQYAQAVLVHERSHRGAPAGYLSVSEAARVRLPVAMFTSQRCVDRVRWPAEPASRRSRSAGVSASVATVR